MSTATEAIPDAEQEVSRLEQQYESEAERVREAKGGAGVLPLAPTAQGSERLPSAGIFREGTRAEAPKPAEVYGRLKNDPGMLHLRALMRTCRLGGRRVPSRKVPMSPKKEKEIFDFDAVTAEAFEAARPLREAALQRRKEREAREEKKPSSIFSKGDTR